jgi:hypothetical protein
MIIYSINKFLLEPIQPKWENDVLEYGVCTRINSQGQPVQENGLCPKFLTCQPRQDKFVCSCGRGKYLDEARNSCCKYLMIIQLSIH